MGKQSVQEETTYAKQDKQKGGGGNRKQQLALGRYFTLPGSIDLETRRFGNIEKYEM